MVAPFLPVKYITFCISVVLHYTDVFLFIYIPFFNEVKGNPAHCLELALVFSVCILNWKLQIIRKEIQNDINKAHVYNVINPNGQQKLAWLFSFFALLGCIDIEFHHFG